MAHRFTRAPLTAVLAALVAAAPLGAQWQGVVTFHDQQNMRDQNTAGDIQYMQGPSGVAKMVVQDREGGPVSIIYNKGQNTATIVMDSRQMYMTMPLDKMQSETQQQMSKLKISETGKTDVVAGHKCTVYHATNAEDTTETDACVATDMGNFMVLDTPGARDHASEGKAFSMIKSLFGAKGGMFPLKVTTYKGGKVREAFEATSIRAASLPASDFVPPSSYKSMSAPGMGGPNR